VLVMEIAQVGAVGLQFGVVKLRWSSWGVQVGVCRSGVVNSWLPFFDGIILPTTSRWIHSGRWFYLANVDCSIHAVTELCTYR
jgi:hypothetical protein